jgi:putative transposase
VIVSQAVLVAIGVDWEGRRQMLAVELANRESRSSWKDFPAVAEGARAARGGVRRVRRPSGLEDGDPRGAGASGLAALLRALPAQALDYVPRKVDDDCLQELRWFYDRRDLGEVRRDLAAWLGKWQSKYAKLCQWVEDNIEETLTYYRLPLAHHKHMKSTNMLERLNQELKRRTHVVRIFPKAESCLRLVRALAVETHENWLEATRYLNMDHLKEHKKQALRALAA